MKGGGGGGGGGEAYNTPLLSRPYNMVHEKRGLVEACYSSSCLDNAIECVVHGCHEKELCALTCYRITLMQRFIVQAFREEFWVNLGQIATQAFSTVSYTEKCPL